VLPAWMMRARRAEHRQSGHMSTTDESPRIGTDDVDAAALDERGRPLADLVRSLDLIPPEDLPEAVPESGWRVLRKHEGNALLGAPAQESGRWWIAGASWRKGYATVDVHEETLALRPSRAERRRGLELRWPSVMVSDSAPTEFFVDLVNVSDRRWATEGDSLKVVGVLTEVGADSFSFGWASSGGASGLALDPGEYARLPVAIESNDWERIEPGDRDLRAVVVGLGLIADPLRVSITAEQIAGHRRRRDPAWSRRDRRRMIDAQRDHVRAARAASRSLAALVEAIVDTPGHEEAVEAIADVLGIDVNTAQSVFHTPLSDLVPSAGPTLQRRLEDLERRDAEA
jgi:hypothetical protein